MALDVIGRYRYPPPNRNWLEQHVEPVLDPDLCIIDAHHHLWNEPGNPYGLADLAEDIDKSGHRVVATVYVQAHANYRQAGPEHLRCVGETAHAEAVRSEAERDGRRARICAGIVGFLDVRDSARLDEVLDAHVAASPSFRGVRQSVARDSHFPDGIVLRPAPPNLLADPAMMAGVRRLGTRGLSFDALLYHQQIPELAAMARAAPDTTIVLNHYGCPIGVGPYVGREQETFATWRHAIGELAACSNVHMKLGGLGMIITGAQYHLKPLPPSSAQLAREWQPWIDASIEAFGTHRCLFESNFPVDKGMYSYGVLWNAFKRATASYSLTERHDLFHRTAAAVYRIDVA